MSTPPLEAIPDPVTTTLPEHILSAPPEAEHATLDAMDNYVLGFPLTIGYKIRVFNTDESSTTRHYECARAGKPPKPVKYTTIQSQCRFSMTASFNTDTSTWRLVHLHLGHTHPFEHFLPAPPETNQTTREEMDEYVQSLAPSYGYTVRVGRSWNKHNKCFYECSRSGKPPEDAKRQSNLTDCVFQIATVFDSSTTSWGLVHEHLGHTHPPDYTVKRRKKRKRGEVDVSDSSIPAPVSEPLTGNQVRTPTQLGISFYQDAIADVALVFNSLLL